MSENLVRSGGCSCGDVRYETIGDPTRVLVCHCKHCQRRTGSAFGIGCYFPKQMVKVVQGSLNSFQRSSDAGRWFKSQFCTVCGSTVLWQLELLPDAIGIAGGSFDNTDWLDPKLHFWAGSAQKWFHFPEDGKILLKQH
jgi:hypothetical protein